MYIYIYKHIHICGDARVKHETNNSNMCVINDSDGGVSVTNETNHSDMCVTTA